MNFKIVDIETHVSPGNLNVDDTLAHYFTTCEEIKNALKECTFQHKNIERGFQIELHEQLEDFFTNFFSAKGLSTYITGYARTIRLESDVAIQSKTSGKSLYIEIEFRPNVYKDIVKFLIGHKRQILELGILIVAINRKIIKEGYTTMPQYKKCIQIVEELQSDCPILVLGIDGSWVPTEG